MCIRTTKKVAAAVKAAMAAPGVMVARFSGAAAGHAGALQQLAARIIAALGDR